MTRTYDPESKESKPSTQSDNSSKQFFGFKSDTARKAFDSLVDSFIEDYMVKKYVAEKSGWRTLTEIAQKARISTSLLYGKHSTIGPALDEPVRRGLVETRIFPGERGRGGEVMRLRLAYDKEPIKEFVNGKIRLGRAATKTEQNASSLTPSPPTTAKPESNIRVSQAIEGGRKLAAIMFTDIVGFTSLAQSDESLSLKLLAKHRELIRMVLARHSGLEIKTVGDSFLVEFDSALEATNCAVEMQQVLHEYNLGTAHKILVRVGIHVGDVVHDAGDVYGDAVNIASRIEPLAQGGEICISEQVYAQVRNKVPFRLVKLPSRDLKNVSFPIDVYKLELPWEERGEENFEGPYDRLRIAVLPFANISPDPNDEYFADGMTEELISTMSKISGLSVIARTSVMGYKDEKKKIDEIVKELKVGTILEGSVRKANGNLRITVQLIDSKSSDHLWAESYDRELKDIFKVQSDISETVANTLKVKLLAEEKVRIEKEPTKSTEAYTMWLKGVYYNLNASSEDDLRKSLKYFERAIELDSSFALGYSWLSDCYTTLAQAGYLSPDEAIPKAESAVRKALELDPDLPDAHRVLGFLLIMGKELDWVGAERETKKALELNPNIAAGHEAHAWILAFMGRFDEALVEAKKALELDPLSTLANQTMTLVLYLSREYERAIEQLNKMREFDPESRSIALRLGLCYLEKSQFDEAIEEFRRRLEPSKGKADLSLSYLAIAYARSGRIDEARKILSDFKEVSKTQFIPALAIAQIHAGLGEKDEAIQLLEKAYDKRDYSSLQELKVSPIWDGFRSDLRFIALLTRIGLGQK